MQTQLKPWTGSERLYFYPQSAQIVGQTGQIGRLRIDFGRHGKALPLQACSRFRSRPIRRFVNGSVGYAIQKLLPPIPCRAWEGSGTDNNPRKGERDRADVKGRAGRQAKEDVPRRDALSPFGSPPPAPAPKRAGAVNAAVFIAEGGKNGPDTLISGRY